MNDDDKSKLRVKLVAVHFSQVRKVLIAELAPPHAESAWGCRGEKIRATGLAAYYNYLSKKEN